MTPYWLLFLLPSYFAFTRTRAVTTLQHWPIQWKFIFVIMVMMIGLRHEVGQDWPHYLQHIVDSKSDLWGRIIIEKNESLYRVLVWIAAETGAGIYFVNTVCALLFTYGLIYFCREQRLPWLALVISIPYLVVVVGMSYTRQSVAIGLVMVALVALGNGDVRRYIYLVLFAVLFHKSATIMLPLLLLLSSKNRLWVIIGASFVLFLIYTVILQHQVDSLLATFYDSKYNSKGAGVRLLLCVLPAIVFLLFRKRFDLTKRQQQIWTWMSISAFGLFGLLFVVPATMVVDRLGLYLIPLQIFVWSNLPTIFGKSSVTTVFVGYSVMFVSAAILFVWLTFAIHAYSWLPYQMYPFID